jgi:hypothetical protein
MVIAQLNSSALINSPATEAKNNNPTFTNKTTNHAESQPKLIKARKCLLQQQHRIIDQTAEDLLQQISYTFKAANLTNYDTSSKGTLPRIISSTKICFFKRISMHLQYLIVNTKLNDSQKITTLEQLIIKINHSQLLATQKLIASDLINSVITCLKLSIDVNASALWQDAASIDITNSTCFYSKNGFPKVNKNNPMLAKQLMLYPISIDLLCIEAEKRFKSSFWSHNDNITDLGMHVLDNEWLYMEKCYRGFLYLLKLQQQTNNAKISFTDLRNVNAILGGYSAYPTTHYSCKVASDMGYEFLQLIKQGLIANNNSFKDSYEGISVIERMQELELFFEAKLNIKIKLKPVIFNDQIYFAVNTPTKTSAQSSLNQQEQQLLDDLHGKTNNKAFLFVINKESQCTDVHPIVIDIYYYYSQDKPLVCQQLLDIYYKKITDFPENTIKKINLAVSLCSIMQRIHPFCDANGRTLFFILLPILLYQMNIWLTRMIPNPWLLLEFANPEIITEMILPLCVAAPKFTTQVDWHKYMSLTETMRISIALGDLTKINELITKQPSLLSQKITISPMIDTIGLLEHCINHDQLTVLQLLLHSLPKEQLKQIQLTNLLAVCDSLQHHAIKEELIKYFKI